MIGKNKKVGYAIYIGGAILLVISMFLPFVRIEAAIDRTYHTMWWWFQLTGLNVGKYIVVIGTLVGALLCARYGEKCKNNVLISFTLPDVFDILFFFLLINSIKSNQMDPYAEILHGIGFYLYILAVVMQIAGCILLVADESRKE